MYEYIKGNLEVKALDYACIDVNGVGYILYIPFKTYEALNELNSTEKLYVHMHVKEDDIRLYGFKTLNERNLFRKIITVSGIGPKIGLAILSVYTPNELITIISSEAAKLLSKVNGLGIKKAQKLIIELKDKVDSMLDENVEVFTNYIIKSEVKQALEALGYNKLKLEDYITDAEIQEIKDSGQIMKIILRKLSMNK